MNRPETTIYHGGRILPMTSAAQPSPDALPEALAVKGERILALGSLEEVRAAAGSNAAEIDLKGAALLPGFYDAHSHFLDAARLSAFYCDLHGRPLGRMTSIDDYIDALRRHMAKLDPGAPVLGSGYDPDTIAEHRHPTRRDLDRVSTDRPVIVSFFTGSMSVLNSRALELLGITRDTPDPEGGAIGRDADEEPNGLLIENAAYGIWDTGRLQRIETPERLFKAIEQESLLYAAKGVTTVNEGSDADLGLFREAVSRGALKQRAVLWMRPEDLLQELQALLDRADSADREIIDVSLRRWGSLPIPAEREGGHRITIGGGKIFADGAMNIGTARLSAPYHMAIEGHAPDYTGTAVLSDEAIAATVKRVTGAGFNMFIHANGDAALDSCIAAYRAVRERDPKGRQHLILLHAQLVREEQFDAMEELCLTPSFFCANIYYSGDRLYERLLGPARACRLDPIGTAFRRGLPATMHQDTPVEPMDPLFSIWSSLTRRTASGRLLGPEERITPYQALLANTLYAARQNGEDWCKGSLEPGKLADLVILDRDPLSCPVEEIKDISVLETIVGGESIWRR